MLEKKKKYYTGLINTISNSNDKNIENQKAKQTIKRKMIRSAQNITRQTPHLAALICPTKIIKKSRDTIKRRTTIKKETGPYQTMRKVNSKFADGSV